jgi:hypothetical protein
MSCTITSYTDPSVMSINRTNSQAPLRFAVLLEGTQLSRWQAECITRLLASGAATLELIIKAVPRQDEAQSLRNTLSRVSQALWLRACLFGGRRAVSSRSPNPKLFHDVEVLACEARIRRGVVELGEMAAEQIRSRRLDIVLFFGENTPADGLATVAVHGIWCFRYGEGLEPSAAMAAFWAAVRRESVVRVELIGFSGGFSADRLLLRSGYFAVPDHSFKRTLAGLMSGSADFPVLACRDVLAGREFAKTLLDTPTASAATGMPGNGMKFKFLIRLYVRKFVSLYEAVLMRDEWNTGFLDATLVDPFQAVTARNVRWLPTNGAKNIAADPFFLRRGDQITLLVEELNPADNCGRIAARVIEGGRIVPLGTVIEERFHSSYPCLVQSHGQIYCVPEQAESKSIMLYRAIDFPRRWERLGPLLPGVEAVDSTLFQHGGYWWLAYTDASIDRNGRLMLWYASELTGRWQPHALNPVKIDPRCSRGAGPVFVYRGALIRPSQDCSVTYGAKVVFNHVITLTPDQFHEEMTGELSPDPEGSYWCGLHTISYDGSVAVVDGKRPRFDLAALPPKWRNHLRRQTSTRPNLAATSQFSPARQD